MAFACKQIIKCYIKGLEVWANSHRIINIDILFLSYSIGTVSCLTLLCWVPMAAIMNYMVSRCDIETCASSNRRHNDDVEALFLFENVNTCLTRKVVDGLCDSWSVQKPTSVPEDASTIRRFSFLIHANL